MKRPPQQKPIDASVLRRLDALERLIDDEYEGSPKVFEVRTGIKMAQVGQWFSGHRALREKAVKRIEEKTGKPEGWFDGNTLAPGANLAGTGSVIGGGASGNVATSGVVFDAPNRVKNKSDEIEIPQFDTGGAMGNGLLLRDQPGVIERWTVNAEWIQKNIKSHTGAANLCIVTGFGDSMKGMFNSGDPLVVDKGVKTVEFDAVYFFRVADEGFIKRLQRIPGEGIRVLSENKRYDSWTIKPGMDFEVFGRVVKAWQGEDF